MGEIVGLVQVKGSSVAFTETFGKFDQVLQPGCHFVPWCFGSQVAGTLSLREQQLDIRCKTKTKDNVFVTVSVSVRYRAIAGREADCFYKHNKTRQHIQDFVSDNIWEWVPKMNLHDLFEQKGYIVTVAGQKLKTVVSNYGYEILHILILEIDPAMPVKIAMGEIGAAHEMRSILCEMSRSQKALKLKKAVEEIESEYLTELNVVRHKNAQVMVVNKQCIEMMREKGHSSKSSDVKENNTAQIGKIWKVASLAIGVQLGWVLQAVILRRLVYNLKINNGWKLIFWACGPISGMVVPLIMEYTTKSGSLWRRKRYIAIGSVLACLGSLLVAFAPDSVPLKKVRHNNLLVNGLYAIGFLILSVSYNMIGSPTKSWLSDLAEGDPRIIRTGNVAFTVFLAFGSILGYIAGSDWELWLSHHSYIIDRGGVELFANVKMLYGIHAILILISAVVVLATMSEPPSNPSSSIQEGNLFKQVKVALKKPMLLLYVVNSLNWFAFYSLVTYSVPWVTDLFHGYDGHHGISNFKMAESQTYYALMLTVLILGLSCLLVGPVSRALGGLNRLWAGTNFLLAALLASTALISHKAEHNRSDPTLKAHTIKIIRTYLYLLFAVLGIVQAGMYSVPQTLSSIYSEKYTREGRVTYKEVSNMSIVIPQLLALVLFSGGPIVGHGYVPVFLCSAVCAVLSGILALKLPDPSYATSSDKLSFTAVYMEEDIKGINCCGVKTRMRSCSPW